MKLFGCVCVIFWKSTSNINKLKKKNPFPPRDSFHCNEQGIFKINSCASYLHRRQLFDRMIEDFSCAIASLRMQTKIKPPAVVYGNDESYFIFFMLEWLATHSQTNKYPPPKGRWIDVFVCHSFMDFIEFDWATYTFKVHSENWISVIGMVRHCVACSSFIVHKVFATNVYNGI